uniref:PX domain-containing protein n=1 Tax=Trieres chinensis TaxID=1514140 RepID=A0A7S2A771_TRICV
MFYLDPKDWSPRFDETFFTIKLESWEVMRSPPERFVGLPKVGGKTDHPAVYYTIRVLCGRSELTCPRRYSEFRWLYEQLRASPPVPVEGSDDRKPVPFPPRTCLFHDSRDEDFLNNRLERLCDFIGYMLRQPGFADHPAMVSFLELESISQAGPVFEEQNN